MTHELGLAGSVSRTFSGLVGHGSNVDVASSDAESGTQIRRPIEARDLRQYDGVLISFDATSLHRQPTATGSVSELVEWLRARMLRSATLNLRVNTQVMEPRPGLPDLIMDALHGRAQVLGLGPPVEAARLTYATWGAQIAGVLKDQPRYPRLWSNPIDCIGERRRLRSLRAIDALEIEW